MYGDTCDYCTGPLLGAGVQGRPWPGRAKAHYCCFGCLSLGEQKAANHLEGHKSDLGTIGFKLGLAILLTGQSMLLGFAVNLTPPAPAVARILQGIVLLATLVVVAVLGGPLLRNTLQEFRQRRITIEALFVTAMTGAFLASLQSFLLGTGPIYFEIVSILLVVYTIGKLIGASSRANALAISNAWSANLSQCRLVDERGRCRQVEAATILPDDRVEVRPGETIAVDGVVVEGVGFVCEAARSGEPFAAVRRPGDRVFAGAVSQDAVFQVRATSPGTEREIDRLLTAVEQARSSPSSLQGQADRLARIFFPIVVTVALLTFLYWTWQSGWQAGLFNSMSVLLVACPCALGLATPIVIWSALGRLAERGLITREGDLIERLAAIDRVVFDKTGTLTEEHFALVDLATVAGDEESHLLNWLSAVQSKSSHPIARAFIHLNSDAEEHPCVVQAFHVVPGAGIEAEVQVAGQTHRLRVGNTEWLQANRRPESPQLLAALHTTVGHQIAVELDGRLTAIAIVAERLRDSAKETLTDLTNLGLQVEVMTGDTSERAEAVLVQSARDESISTVGSLLPQDKQRLLAKRMTAGARPLFVGDGINDGPALATATAGIALASGTDLAIGASSATLYDGDLRAIPWAIALSRQATRIARATILWAALYNLGGMTLAALGLLHPVAAAVLMTASSLLVAWLSSRVGSIPVTCPCPTPTSDQPLAAVRTLSWRTAIHTMGLALQGILLAVLLNIAWPAAGGMLFGCLIGAMVLALMWQRWDTIPHGVDMLFGMATVGNLGMLTGWWVDNGFGPVKEGCGCGCDKVMSAGFDWQALTQVPGMWLGMLVTANVAMLFLGRTTCPASRQERWAMFGGGNLGMIAGMILGGGIGGLLAPTLAWPSAATHLAGMMVGMLLGMYAGHVLLLRASQFFGKETEGPSPS